MADITNVQAVAFCNERVRVAANKFAALYWWCKEVSEDWTAQGVGALIPNDASVLIDGSATDGRSVITGADVNALAARVGEFVALLEANSNTKLNQICKVATYQG
jgi:hypothetical protein